MREQEPQYKKCPDVCNGKGWFYLRKYFTVEFEPITYLPRFIRCKVCNGSGAVEMSEDEILQARDAERDHQADLMNDN